MPDWNPCLAEAIAALGRDAFPALLDRAVAQLFDYRICMGFAYDGTATPQALYHNMAPQTAQVVIWDYCLGPYLLDPIFAQVEAGRRSGMVGLRQISPDKFFQSEYYATHYHHTGIRDEIAIFCGLEGGRVAVLSFARDRSKPMFSARDQARLASAAPVIEALARAHWSGGRTPATALPPLQVVIDRIARGVLTPREAEVIAMVLRGYSTTAMGARLEISDQTVKVHRKNAYRKLAISSQAELFSVFLAGLEPG